MQKVKLRNKTGLYGILIERIEKLRKPYQEIIPFPDVFGMICRNFSINKQTCWEVLMFLHDLRFIEIVPGHGVRILTIS